MKIAVAGANSFIGRRLIPIFSRSHQVTAIFRENSKDKGIFSDIRGVSEAECNMENYGRLGAMLEGIDCFIDLSWAGSRGRARQDYALQKFNYECSISAVRSMAESGCKILVSSGSQAEYGICRDVITEETECRPDTEYGKFKLRLFHEAKEIADRFGIRFIEPRYFSLYGPGDYENTLIMLCVRKMLANEDVLLNDCQQIWDYMYIDDAIAGLLRLCESPRLCGVYNFASGEQRTLHDFVMEIHGTLHSGSKVVFGAAEYNGALIDLRPSVKKLVHDTGLKPSVTFQEGILRTAGRL